MQDHDAAADRLRHRRRTLPELAELAQVEAEGTAVDASLVEVVGRRDEVARRQRRMEDELATVERKRAEARVLLYGGTVKLMRELQALQTEVESLERRGSALEDGALEAMTEREPLDDEVAALEARRTDLDRQAVEARVRLAEAESAIDAELATEVAARAEATEGIPPPVMATYERLRARLDGVGVARLVNGRCDGCHLSLSVTELANAGRLPADTLLHCEQCGRILVR